MSPRRVHKIRGVDVRIHSSPLRVVEHVEGFRAKLDRNLLRRLEDFVNRHIKIRAPRIIQAVASGIAESQPLSLDKCRTVEERDALRSLS